jgi:hypothetical protein
VSTAKPTASDRIEVFAALYRRHTGHMAPFKDVPAELRIDNHSDENRARYSEWCATELFTALANRVIELEAQLQQVTDELHELGGGVL